MALSTVHYSLVLLFALTYGVILCIEVHQSFHQEVEALQLVACTRDTKVRPTIEMIQCYLHISQYIALVIHLHHSQFICCESYAFLFDFEQRNFNGQIIGYDRVFEGSWPILAALVPPAVRISDIATQIYNDACLLGQDEVFPE